MDITQPDKEHTTTNQEIPMIMDNNQPDLDNNQLDAPTGTNTTRSGTQNPYPTDQNNHALAQSTILIDTEVMIPLADLPTRSENNGEIDSTLQPTLDTPIPHTDETNSQDGTNNSQ
ncbi:5327_t:CDS:2 [Gigaspora margarita]|uniref:5327_t:CDS:1 n=1 Tax=Gigaspora margarita TaxID=4874 RepID=A0ABN7VHM8_GIGMA|nr:5327_t:CDS:2 [Gigaspora margarita]